MIRTGDVYKYNRSENTMMLSNFATGDDLDFWEEYRTNYSRYDAVFNRMFNSFWYFMQEEDATVSEVAEQFRTDVYNHLLMNKKKYEELYRVHIIPDEDYSLINNYDMTETMDRDSTDNQDNTYGSRQDSESFTKGSRSDSSTNTYGEQTVTGTHKVAPYDSTEFSNESQDVTVNGQRQDGVSFTEGQQLDSSSSTKGSQIDDLNRTMTEDYTLRRVGNIGVQTVTDMLCKHVKLWDMWTFYEYIFKEICKELLLL